MLERAVATASDITSAMLDKVEIVVAANGKTI